MQAEDEQIISIEENIENLMTTHGNLSRLLSDYDKKLSNVLDRHEQDFLSAYKVHMNKVERELFLLKNKASDQETRLAKDEKILRKEEKLVWFETEASRLAKEIDTNDNELDALTGKVKELEGDKKFMSDQVKAAKR